MSLIREIISGAFGLYEFMVLARVLVSWLPGERDILSSGPGAFLRRATEPLLLICREIMYSVLKIIGVDERRMPLDFSPILALAAVHLVRNALMALLG